MKGRRGRGAFALALGSLALAGAAHAQAPGARVALHYEAPAECPRVDQIEERLLARGVALDPRASFAGHVTIERRPGGLEGRLVTSTGVTRTFTEPSCTTLADALAIALAIAAASAEPARLPVVAPPPGEPPPRAEPTRPRGGFALGVDLALASHLGPRLALGGAAFGELEAFRVRGAALVVRLALEAVSSGTSAGTGAAEGARASFTWLGARAELGALRLPVGNAEVRLALGVGAGVLRAEALDVRDARSVWAPLVELGPVARLRAPVGPVVLELGAAFVVPLVRARFVLAPSDAVLFSVPPVGAMFSVGVAVARDAW